MKRCYVFIEGAKTYDRAESIDDFYQSAVAFGNFQRLLSDYPAETLHETIKGFHDTKARFETFKKAVREDVCGLAMNDFGDSIRFGASTAAEDERDLDKVSCDMELFEIYAKGYIKGCGGKLTGKEIELMPMGAKVMTFEYGIRFLTDYLQGDIYFKIHREGQNLDRCRTPFKLVEDMGNKWQTMQEIISKYIRQ